MRIVAVVAAALGCAWAQDVPAFPGAEGFGAYARGGRGGKVLWVDNLNDAGPGSLRAAVEAKGPRIVVFRTGGIIDLKSNLRVREPFLTIAGQTAPGDGVCLRNRTLSIETNDVIVRHVRVRFGDFAGVEGDAVSIASGSRRVIVDHCSASWSIDESLSPSGDIRDVTVQWCFITESLYRSIHAKGPHGYGSLVRATGGVTLHHNLWAHHNGRNPRLGDNYGEPPWPVYDVRNNVMYNWGSYCTGVVDGQIRVNYVANYLKPGPATRVSRNPISIGEEASENTRFFLAWNVMEQRQDLIDNNARMFDRMVLNGRPLVTVAEEPFEVPAVLTDHPMDAFERVLAGAGATKPVRDAIDDRVALTVRLGTGRLIDAPGDVGGWPVYAAGVPPVDTDEDGMPDDWELARGLDPLDASDGARPGPDGYTWVEIHLNELADK